MKPSKYTESYSNLWTWVVGPDDDPVWVAAPIRNYLQNNFESAETKEQAQRAKTAWENLMRAIVTRLGGQPKPVFTIGPDTYVLLSLQRVFWGKGAPSEIQDALWLASFLGVLKAADVDRYCRLNLGVDCGGLVANYWGIGKPSITELQPTVAAGMKPRYVWEDGRARRRKSPGQIKIGDAAIFFQGTFNGNDPSTLAPQKADGSYDTSKGTKAFHIGLVDSVSYAGDKVVQLGIAESSGQTNSTSTGNGVNVHDVEVRSTTGGGNLVGCVLPSTNRIYFVGPKDEKIAPYLSQFD